MKTIHSPTELWVEEGALTNLGTLHGRRVFTVTGPFMVDSGFMNEVTKHLAKSEWQIFSDITPDPPIDKIAVGTRQLAAFQRDAILALGGGSAIDAARAMKFLDKRALQAQIARSIVVPTISGAGLEITNFSVTTVAEIGTKIPLVTDEIQPEIAVLDTNLVMSMSPKITADTGMDILTHAIEAYVPTKVNPILDALCERIVRLVFDNLEVTLNRDSNQQAREDMYLASCMARTASSITSLGLNHGIACAAGARLHAPHGRVNAMFLPGVVAYNSGSVNGKVTNELTAKHCAQLINCLNDTQTTDARTDV